MISNKEYTRLKGRLTRAKNSGDPEKVLEEVEYAFSIFDEQGWPDGWPTWQVAKHDAECDIRYGIGVEE